MKSESIIRGTWTPHFPNPVLAPAFRQEENALALGSGMEGRVFGYVEKRVEALPGVYYRLNVEFSAQGITDILRSVLCLVEWEQERETQERRAQEIMSAFWTQDECGTILGSLLCRAPLGTRYARIQLGLRYADNAKIVFRSAVWSQAQSPLPRGVKIGVCSWNPAKAGGEDTYEQQLVRLLQSAGDAGCDIMLLPEFCDTYQWRANFLSTVPLLENKAVRVASLYAQKHQMYICAPVVEKDGDIFYNTSVLLDRGGEVVGKYRKTHLYWPEACNWALTPGDEYPVFKLDFGTIRIQTCYDNWNADVCKLLALKGAELILMPNEGYDPLIMPARAVDNRIYLAISSLAFECAVYNTKGEKTGRDEGMLRVADIDLNERIPPYPVAGGSCNYAMSARRSVHNSISNRVYMELLHEINRWEEVQEEFVDPRGDIRGDLVR